MTYYQIYAGMRSLPRPAPCPYVKATQPTIARVLVRGSLIALRVLPAYTLSSPAVAVHVLIVEVSTQEGTAQD